MCFIIVCYCLLCCLYVLLCFAVFLLCFAMFSCEIRLIWNLFQKLSLFQICNTKCLYFCWTVGIYLYLKSLNFITKIYLMIFLATFRIWIFAPNNNIKFTKSTHKNVIWNLMIYFPLWIFMWYLTKFDLKDLPHISHLNGRTLPWVLVWWYTSLALHL